MDYNDMLQLMLCFKYDLSKFKMLTNAQLTKEGVHNYVPTQLEAMSVLVYLVTYCILMAGHVQVGDCVN